jgi:hypothetical protein
MEAGAVGVETWSIDGPSNHDGASVVLKRRDDNALEVLVTHAGDDDRGRPGVEAWKVAIEIVEALNARIPA